MPPRLRVRAEARSRGGRGTGRTASRRGGRRRRLPSRTGARRGPRRGRCPGAGPGGRSRRGRRWLRLRLRHHLRVEHSARRVGDDVFEESWDVLRPGVGHSQREQVFRVAAEESLRRRVSAHGQEQVSYVRVLLQPGVEPLADVLRERPGPLRVHRSHRCEASCGDHCASAAPSAGSKPERGGFALNHNAPSATGTRAATDHIRPRRRAGPRRTRPSVSQDSSIHTSASVIHPGSCQGAEPDEGCGALISDDSNPNWFTA